MFQKAIDSAKRHYIAERKCFKTLVAERISRDEDDSANVNYHEAGECLIVNHEQEQHGSPPKKPKSSHFCIFKNQDWPTHIVRNPKTGKTAYARIKYMAKGRWHDPFELDINGKFVQIMAQ